MFSVWQVVTREVGVGVLRRAKRQIDSLSSRGSWRSGEATVVMFWCFGGRWDEVR
jgi:hypothetical protein